MRKLNSTQLGAAIYFVLATVFFQGKVGCWFWFTRSIGELYSYVKT